MQSYFSCLVLLLFAASTASAQMQMPEDKPFEKIIRDKYILDDNQILQLSLRIEQRYDKAGNILEQEYFYLGGNEELQRDRRKVYTYDDKNRHLKTLDYNGDDILESETKTTWDEYGNKNRVENINYIGGEARRQLYYELLYDGKGNKDSERFYDKEGNLEKERSWKYNRMDEVVRSTTVIRRPGEAEKKIVARYQYNHAGDLVKSIHRETYGSLKKLDVRFFENNHVVRWLKYQDGKLVSEYQNEYRDSVIVRTVARNRKDIAQSAGKDVAATQEKEAALEEIWVTDTEYDDDGNVVRMVERMDGAVRQETQFYYDRENRRETIVKYNPARNRRTRTHYDYDLQGNPERVQYFVNGLLQSEERYHYNYYPLHTEE